MGDNVQIAGFEGEFDYFLNNPIFRERVFSTIAGNHELKVDKNDTSQENTAFADHFYQPNLTEYGQTLNINDDRTKTFIPGDYYYTYGDTLFLNLNTNNKNSLEHKTFIEEAIKEATKKRGSNFSWKVVSFHHAPYSTATHTEDKDILQRRHELVRIFNENDIDIVLGGHDHIYARSKQMLAGEQALEFEKAYGIKESDKNAKVENNYTSTYNNQIYKNGKIVVDGIGLDYNRKEVTNPRGTLFLTLASASGSKFYNPIGEQQWFVNKSLDDRNQLLTHFTFNKNQFKLETMDPYGKIIDHYTINKTDDFIANPNMNDQSITKAKLADFISEVEKYKPVDNKDNLNLYEKSLASAKEVLNNTYTSQEELDAAIEVLNTRLSSVEFLAKKVENNTKVSKEIKGEKVPKSNIRKDKKINRTNKKSTNINKKISRKSNNPKTGIANLTGVYASLSIATAGLYAIKRK